MSAPASPGRVAATLPSWQGLAWQGSGKLSRVRISSGCSGRRRRLLTGCCHTIRCGGRGRRIAIVSAAVCHFQPSITGLFTAPKWSGFLKRSPILAPDVAGLSENPVNFGPKMGYLTETSPFGGLNVVGLFKTSPFWGPNVAGFLLELAPFGARKGPILAGLIISNPFWGQKWSGFYSVTLRQDAWICGVAPSGKRPYRHDYCMLASASILPSKKMLRQDSHSPRRSIYFRSFCYLVRGLQLKKLIISSALTGAMPFASTPTSYRRIPSSRFLIL